MRVLVTADEAASFRPGHEDTGHYKIALTLLAILVGFPNQAALMFRQLLKAEDTSWSAFHARLAAGCAETHHAAADGQAELKRSRQNDKTTTPRQPTGRYMNVTESSQAMTNQGDGNASFNTWAS